jgi:hypothetical protein
MRARANPLPRHGSETKSRRQAGVCRKRFRESLDRALTHVNERLLLLVDSDVVGQEGPFREFCTLRTTRP